MTTCIKFNPVSLLDRIKQAETLDDLALLTLEGMQYEYASEKTRNRWWHVTRTRKIELKANLVKDGLDAKGRVTKKTRKGK